ncbi:TPA: bacitracin resistance transcriptional activator BcrR, partial [Streptococcus pyogenes]
LIVIGIAKIILTHLDKETWGGIATKCSLGLTALAICFLAAAREPYITALMFLLFVAKIVVWIKQNGTK